VLSKGKRPNVDTMCICVSQYVYVYMHVQICVYAHEYVYGNEFEFAYVHVCLHANSSANRAYQIEEMNELHLCVFFVITCMYIYVHLYVCAYVCEYDAYPSHPNGEP